jgi:hypothetical protein
MAQSGKQPAERAERVVTEHERRVPAVLTLDALRPVRGTALERRPDTT